MEIYAARLRAVKALRRGCKSLRLAPCEIFVGRLFGSGMKNYIRSIDFDEVEGFESFRNLVEIS